MNHAVRFAGGEEYSGSEVRDPAAGCALAPEYTC